MCVLLSHSGSIDPRSPRKRGLGTSCSPPPPIRPSPERPPSGREKSSDRAVARLKHPTEWPQIGFRTASRLRVEMRLSHWGPVSMSAVTTNVSFHSVGTDGVLFNAAQQNFYLVDQT